jgi:hypothetical protein
VSVQHGAVTFGAIYLPLCHACIHMQIYGVKSDGTVKFTHGAMTFGALSEVQICKSFRRDPNIYLFKKILNCKKYTHPGAPGHSRVAPSHPMPPAGARRVERLRDPTAKAARCHARKAATARMTHARRGLATRPHLPAPCVVYGGVAGRAATRDGCSLQLRLLQ